MEKVKIAVIDDELDFGQRVCECIKSSIQHLEQIELTQFSSAEEFLERMDQGQKFDVMFTDIEMNQMNGIELGRIMTEKSPNTLLIFVTAYAEFAAESYLLGTYQYVLKQDMERRLPEIVHKALEKVKKEKTKYIVIGSDTNFEKIALMDLVYISKEGKYVEYHLAGNVCRERDTIHRVIERLESDEFILVDKGVIVNMNHIMKLQGNQIYLDNREQVTISRGKLADAKRAINNYWRDSK